MDYILSLLLLVFNLIHYQVGFGTAIYTVVNSLLFFVLFYVVQRKTKSFLTTCLVLFCYTWQISWINIFGKPTSELQLPWFYVIGIFILGYAVINVNKIIHREYSARNVIVFLSFFVISAMPVLTSQSQKEAMKEYILIMFFAVILFAGFLFAETVSAENYEYFKNSFIWAIFTVCVALIFQYAMYRFAHVSLFKLEYMPSFSGKYQISCYLLMEDHSCSTVMLGCAVFYILEKIKKENFYYLIPLMGVIMIALAITSRRTSTISLIITLALYVFFHYKGMGKKTLYIFAFTAAIGVFLYLITLNRPVDTIMQLFDDNGRLKIYVNGIKLFFEHPLGVGYDNVYLVKQVGGILPHNTIIRWLDMGGFVFTFLMMWVFAIPVVTSWRKKMTGNYWTLLYSILASMFIPDILNARFFIIPCAMAMLYKGTEKTEDNTVKELIDVGKA